jgi:hypothetical protein
LPATRGSAAVGDATPRPPLRTQHGPWFARILRVAQVPAVSPVGERIPPPSVSPRPCKGLQHICFSPPQPGAGQPHPPVQPDTATGFARRPIPACCLTSSGDLREAQIASIEKESRCRHSRKNRCWHQSHAGASVPQFQLHADR